jgi:hypothetical protein
VLDGVHEQFPEGDGDVVARLRREVAVDFPQVVGRALGRVELAPDVEGNPVRTSRDDADVVLPGAASRAC